VVGVERPAVELEGDQHVVGQGVIEQHDRAVAGHAVEVGHDLTARQRRQFGQPDGDGLCHGTPDLDDRVGRDRGGGVVEVGAEAREGYGRFSGNSSACGLVGV
jgi:hypothetical protein